MSTKTAALLIGFIFLVLGILGFFDNPVVGASEKAIFHTDTMHNWVHIASGALFVLIALAAPGSAAGFLKLFGFVYFALGVIGIIQFGMDGMGKVLGILHVNGADNILHIALGIVIFAAGFMKGRTAAA